MSEPLFDEPIDSPYWDTTGLLEGVKILGHKMTPEELDSFRSTLYCGQYPWIEQGGILWRWTVE